MRRGSATAQPLRQSSPASRWEGARPRWGGQAQDPEDGPPRTLSAELDATLAELSAHITLALASRGTNEHHTLGIAP